MKAIIKLQQRREPAKPGDLIAALDQKVAGIMDDMVRQPFYSRFLNGGLKREEYAYMLVQTYHYVMITPDTYQWAIETMRKRPRAHYGRFLADFEEHWKEELGHEHWLLQDLNVLGYDGSSLVKRIGPNPAVEAYIALSKFVCSGPAPLGLLGQDYFLESLAQAYGALILRGLGASAIPNVMDAVKFIAGHGEADIKHMAMNRASVARIEDPAEREAILRMAEATGWLYASIPHYYEPLRG